MSKNRLELPEKLAKKLAGMVDDLWYDEEIVIVAWGFELVLYKNRDHSIKVYISDTSGG